MIRMIYIEDVDRRIRKALTTEVTWNAGGRIKAYNMYTHKAEELKLSGLQRLLMAMDRRVKVERRRYPGWRGEIPFYVYACDINGGKQYLLDYPHGYGNELYF